MDRLFLDANVLFSAAYRSHSGIKKFWSLSSAKLITSSYALEEARRNLTHPDQHKRLDTLIKPIEVHTEYDETLIPPNITLRDKDRPILAAAIGTRAHYLITGDSRDFGSFYGKQISNVMILTPSEYLQRRP